MKIFTISGLGANEKVFRKLSERNMELVHIPWIMPKKDESIDDYVQRLVSHIDFPERFYIMGLSFGGVVAQRLGHYLKSKSDYYKFEIILLSTIKSETEKPLYIRINRFFPFYQFFPYFVLTSDFILSTFEKIQQLFNPRLPKLTEIYTFREKKYLAWAFKTIVGLRFEARSDGIQIHHIHGENDWVFSISNIVDPIVIKNASHLAVYEKSEEVSEILNNLVHR